MGPNPSNKSSLSVSRVAEKILVGIYIYIYIFYITLNLPDWHVRVLEVPGEAVLSKDRSPDAREGRPLL